MRRLRRDECDFNTAATDTRTLWDLLFDERRLELLMLTSEGKFEVAYHINRIESLLAEARVVGNAA